jgi:D-inositol-3-phosphate glycosyltransferase
MEAVIAKQAQSLIDRGHSVTIVTCRPEKAASLDEVQGNGVVVKRFRSANFIENLFGVTFPIIAPHHLFWFLKHVPEYDVVHIHDVFYMSSWLAGVACRMRKKAYFLTQHVGIVEHPSKLVLFIEKMVYALFGDRILRNASKVVAYNDNVVKFLKSRGVKADAIIQNYNGIDTDHFSPAKAAEKKALRKQYGFKQDARIVLFVGRLVPKKGYQLVLDGADAGNTYIIAGYGIVPPRYNALSSVTFFGPATQEQLRDLYRLSDVFVFPSIGEIFTLVHQEALASGLPVIVAEDPGYKRYDIDRTRMLMPKRTVSAVTKAISSALDNPALQRAMSQYGRQLALERFSWENNYPKEYAIYELGDKA